MRTSRARPLSLALAVFAVVGVVACVSASSAGAEPSTKPFEIEQGSFHLTPSTDRAGAHENLTTSFNFAHSKTERTYNDLKDVAVNLPAGFAGSDTAVPTCSPAQLLGGSLTKSLCPAGSQVGTITLDLTIDYEAVRETYPVYNMEVSSFGTTAQFGYKTLVLSQLLSITARPGNLGLTVTAPEIDEIAEPHDVSVTIWGVPAAAEHDAERGRVCVALSTTPVAECFGGGEEADVPVKPLLSNPTSCGAFTASMKADSWEQPQPASWLTAPVEVGLLGASDEVGPIAECERVPFDPSVEVQPTTTSAESPTGLDVSLLVPQKQSWEEPYSVATANLEDAKVTLPEGFTVNPGAGSGLGACTPRQYESETAQSPPGAGCPPEAKIGSIEIETPLLAEKIPGAIYIATPYDNVPEFGSPEHPGGSLLALYVVAKDPARGILVKVAGKLEPNTVTGQLTSTFDNNPQQPFSKFTLKFRPGATAPLVSPPACGTYSTQAELSPWSAPTEPHFLSSSFQITEGVHEGPCPSGDVPPFKPQVISGTNNNNAGSYSPFYLRIVREDGEQEITRFSTTLPPGLTGNLSGIPFCPDASIEAAKGVTGAEEEAHPACPAASEIGHTIVSAGVGTVLAQTPGKVYLAGPYNGAPLSIVSITSAKVGPFDLGTVVIRFALNINPTTAQVEVSANGSDPIPHIIRGIVVHVREIRVYMDRSKFILNPTSCTPMSIAETIDGAGANFTDPSDQVPVAVNTPFEAADCSSLTFKPGFKVTTTGKTSRKEGAGLSVKLTMPGALGTQANIKEVKVDLPKQLPSRLTTLQKACTAAQFNTNPAGCPAASVIGTAKAITPILPVPLEGPAYFVSHGGEAFPELEVVLQGYGFTIVLTGNTFISKAGITSSTFKTVPDQPVGSFEITLPQGKYSALAANGNLCAPTKTVTTKKTVKEKVHGKTKKVTKKTTKQVAESLAMPTAFVGQNGAEIHESTPVSVSGCAKAKPAKKAKKKAKGKRGKKKK